MAYRNDIDALAARDEVLAREVADKQRERADVQRLLEEARAAEVATAPERDVMIGQRRLRRIAIGGTALIAAGVAAGAVFVERRIQSRTSSLTPAELADRQQQIARDEKVAYDLALASKGLEPVSLEPRFIGGHDGFASREELDAAFGQTVEPWQEFLYTHDAHTRPAIASDVITGWTVVEPEFVKDNFGGVWRVQRRVIASRTEAVTAAGCEPGARYGARLPDRVTRQVWLLPLGSSFRGDFEVAYAAPELAVSYAAGGCPTPP